MAVTFTGAGSANAASGASPQAVTTTSALAVGDYLVVLISYDNSGGGGADPMTGTISATPASGALGASVSAQTGLNDPSTASSGLAARCVAFPVTTAISSGTSVNIAWSGTIVVRAVAFMKVSGAVYRTNSGSTGGNTVGATASTALVTPTANNTDGVLCWAAHENGAAITGDADTTNGTWSAVSGTFNGTGATGMAAYFQSKVVTATATQSFSATGTSSDWITGCLIFRAVVDTAASTTTSWGATTLTATGDVHAILDPGTITTSWGATTLTATGDITRVNLTLAGFQFFEDDAAPATSSPTVAQNTNLALPDTSKILLLRVLIQNTDSRSDPSAESLWLQISINSGAYANVASTGRIKTASSAFINLVATLSASRITGGSGSFINGTALEGAVAVTITPALTAGNYSEYAWTIAYDDTVGAVGDTIDFRITRGSSTQNDTNNFTYTYTPRIIVATVQTGTITSAWGATTLTATGAPEKVATTTTAWGATVLTATGVPDHPATTTSAWGATTLTATGTAVTPPAQVFFRASGSTSTGPNVHLGDNAINLRGTNQGWSAQLLGAKAPDGGGGSTTWSTVAGPTPGVELGTNYITGPIDQDVTIAGTITAHLWAYENNASANAAINCILFRMDSQGSLTEIGRSANTTELPAGSSGVATTFDVTITPTSTNMLKGDRLLARVFGDDAGTMASGFAIGFWRDGYIDTGIEQPGYSFIQFTESFGFQVTEPSGSILYLTSVTGPAVGSAVEKEMWTSRGSTATAAVVNTATGFTAPIQWTDSAGGTVIEWYSKRVEAFTLDGLVRVNLRAHESSASANAGIRAELAIVNSDGSGAVVWGANDIIDLDTPASETGGGNTSLDGELTTTQAAVRGWLAGEATSVTQGQRLRLRVFVDDCSATALASSFTATLTYDGPTGGASGDTWIQLPQSVTEYVPSGTDWPGTVTDNWGTITATASATPDHPATVTSAWGATVLTATATVEHPATITTGWGATTLTATATVERSATITTSWGATVLTATGAPDHVATITSSWGATTLTASATPDHPATVTTSWGATVLTATASAIEHPGTVTSSWGSLTATASATVEIPATIATNWGSISATAAATIEHSGSVATTWVMTATAVASALEHPATITTSWGGITTSAFATPEISSVIITSWGAWSANAVGDLLGNVAGLIITSWGTVTTSATATVEHAASVSTTWTSTLTATGTRETAATVASSWGATVFSATATPDHPATIATSWAGWTATASAPFLEHPGAITTSWGTTAASATAVVSHPATISSSWGGLSASATASVDHPASITTSWGGWTATAMATPEVSSVVISNWGATTFSATGTVTHPASITTTWGATTFSAAGVVSHEYAATISTTWGTWTATATGAPDHAATISTGWGAVSFTATGTVYVPVEVSASATSSWSATFSAVGTVILSDVIGQWNGHSFVEWQMGADPIVAWQMT